MKNLLIRTFAVLSILSSTGVLSPSALAQTAGTGPVLYGVSFNEKKLVMIDPNTGAGTFITNLTMKPLDLAVSGNALYVYSGGLNSWKLSSIDPLTGAIGHQLEFTNKIAGGEGALAFRTDGIAFASTSDSTTGTLFRLELPVAQATMITSDGGMSSSLDGMAFDGSGVLYGLKQFGSALYSIDQYTGELTLIGNTDISFPFNGTVVAGLAFAPDGTLYAALGGAAESRLYRINKTNGVATLIGSIGFGGISGIAFFTRPPGPLTILHTDSGMRISWPHASGGVLESATPISGSWTNEALSVNTNGAEAWVSAPTNGNQRYYRLSR